MLNLTVWDFQAKHLFPKHSSRYMISDEWYTNYEAIGWILVRNPLSIGWSTLYNWKTRFVNLSWMSWLYLGYIWGRHKNWIWCSRLRPACIQINFDLLHRPQHCPLGGLAAQPSGYRIDASLNHTRRWRNLWLRMFLNGYECFAFPNVIQFIDHTFLNGTILNEHNTQHLWFWISKFTLSFNSKY